MRGEPGTEAPGDVLHERRVGQDQPVTKCLVVGDSEFVPQSLGVLPCHECRIRPSRAFSLVPTMQRSTSSAARAAAAAAITHSPGRGRPDRDQAESERDRRKKAHHEHAAMLLGVPVSPRDGADTIAARKPRGVAQLVERRSPKPNVAGSSPVAPVPSRTRHRPGGAERRWWEGERRWCEGKPCGAGRPPCPRCSSFWSPPCWSGRRGTRRSLRRRPTCRCRRPASCSRRPWRYGRHPPCTPGS